jgi:hypothetical protein
MQVDWENSWRCSIYEHQAAVTNEQPVHLNLDLQL